MSHLLLRVEESPTNKHLAFPVSVLKKTTKETTDEEAVFA